MTQQSILHLVVNREVVTINTLMVRQLVGGGAVPARSSYTCGQVFTVFLVGCSQTCRAVHVVVVIQSASQVHNSDTLPVRINIHVSRSTQQAITDTGVTKHFYGLHQYDLTSI